MKIKEVRGRLWIVGFPAEGPIGPYENTRAGRVEAQEDQRGLERFLKYGDKPGFATADKPI